MSTLLHYAVDRFSKRALFMSSSQIERGFRNNWGRKTSQQPDELLTDLDLWFQLELSDVIGIDDVGTEGSEHVVKFIRQAIDFCSATNKCLILTTNLSDKTLWKYLGEDERDESRRSSYTLLDFKNTMPDLRKKLL